MIHTLRETLKNKKNIYKLFTNKKLSKKLNLLNEYTQMLQLSDEIKILTLIHLNDAKQQCSRIIHHQDNTLKKY